MLYFAEVEGSDENCRPVFESMDEAVEMIDFEIFVDIPSITYTVRIIRTRTIRNLFTATINADDTIFKIT